MTLEIDGWRLDDTARTATRDGRVEQLSPRAIRLLRVLVEANGAVVSRGDLLDRVWPNVFVSDESLTQVVSEVRRKLANRQLIGTVARGGYRLTAPIKPSHDIAKPRMIEEPAFPLDAYVLCIEASQCFEAAPEGVYRTFVDLAAQAAALAPDYAEARALHAMALLKRHVIFSEGAMLLEAALSEAEVAKALCPTHAGAHLVDASARIAIGELDQGLQSLGTALSLARDDATMHLDAALLLLSMGNRRAAAALATRSAQLAPEQYRADCLLARILVCTDPHRARVAAERALSKVRETLATDPRSMRALYALGPLLAQVGDHRAARSALEGIAHHDSSLEYLRAVGFALIGDTSSSLERLDFLAMRGWRHACLPEYDDGFQSLRRDEAYRQFQVKMLAA